MKEKNVDSSFDVRDFVGGVASFDGSSQQSVQNNESPQPIKQTVRTGLSVPTESAEPIRRTSSKQRKASLDEYREQFLKVPKITDRQPVFVSRTTRDRIDDIVRKLGERRMSVSGFLENLANHHLELYREEMEQWKRL